MQLAVLREKGERAILTALAEDIYVVDSAALKSAVDTLQSALNGNAEGKKGVGHATQVLYENPDPATIPLLLRVYDKALPGASPWEAMGLYRDQGIAARALAETLKAMSGKNKNGAASTHFEVLLKNRQHLTRKDVLDIINSPGMKDPNFIADETAGSKVTHLLAGVAGEQDVPLLAAMMAEHCTLSEISDLKEIREVFLKYPDAAKPPLRKALQLGMKPGEYKPWSHDLSHLRRVPGILPLIAEMSAEVRDEQAVPILAFYGSTKLRELEDMVPVAARCLARIDGPAAMKALRAIAPAGFEERVKLGDPVAVDKVLARAKAIEGTMSDDTGESSRLRALVRSLGTPEGEDVEQWWVKARPGFAKAFQSKYGFDPDAQPVPSTTTPATLSLLSLCRLAMLIRRR